MKTTRNIIVITTALSLGLGASLSASTLGKHPVDFAPHKHGASNASGAYGDYALLKRIGPPGKGVVRTNTSRAK